MRVSFSLYPFLFQLLCLTFCTLVYAQGGSYVSKGGIITGRRNLRVSSDAASGDYEFVLSGASDGGNRNAERNQYLDESLMRGQGFAPAGVRGSKDCRAEAWARVNSGQRHIDISGDANDVAYTVVTIFKSKVTLNINAITTRTDYSGHGKRSSVRLRAPSGSGVKLVSFFFDDPVELRGQGNGDALFDQYGFGDSDGYAAILYPENVSPPSSLSIKSYDRRSSPPGEYASVVINIPVVGGSTGPGGPGGSGGSNAKDTLGRNEYLNANEKIESPNGEYRARFQGDGNFVLRNRAGRALWATDTNRKGAVRMVMQSDGNLVIYTASGRSVWSSRTRGSGATKLVIKNYGKLKIEKSNGADVKILN